MPAKPRRKSVKPPAGPHWRWFLVEAAVAGPNRYRAAGNVYPWWQVRLTSVLGKTPIETIWRQVDLDITTPLRVLVRAPGWALGVQVAFGGATVGNPVPATVTDLGERDPRRPNAGIDDPLYNVETMLL